MVSNSRDRVRDIINTDREYILNRAKCLFIQRNGYSEKEESFLFHPMHKVGA